MGYMLQFMALLLVTVVRTANKARGSERGYPGRKIKKTDHSYVNISLNEK